MDWNTTTSANDDEIVFKIRRSVIAEALRSDFEMPIPVTDANIDVVVNQIAFQIEEFSTGVPTEFFDLGIDHHKGNDFYRKVYGIFDGRRCGLSWSSEDKSLVYFAVADEADGLTVFHIPSAALAQIGRRDQGDLACINGAVQDFHVDDAYAENGRVLEFARNPLRPPSSVRIASRNSVFSGRSTCIARTGQSTSKPQSTISPSRPTAVTWQPFAGSPMRSWLPKSRRPASR